MHTKPLILAALLAAAASGAPAQPVWRCGNSYSQQPCPGGTPVSSADARSPAQAATATRVANADAKLAAEMEKARHEQERNAPKAIVIGPQSPASAPAGERERERQGTKAKAGRLEQFTAVSPRQPGEKVKKHRKKKAV